MGNSIDNQNITETALRFNAIINTAIDGIITIDTQGIVESVNPSSAQLFGYEAAEIIGQNIKMLMPSPYQEEHDGYLHNYHHTRKPKIIGIGREVNGRRKDGSTFPMRLAVSEVKFSDRTIYTGIVHDLSEVKKAEAETLQLNKELEQKVKKRTQELADTVNILLETNQQLEHEIKERKLAEKALRLSLEKEKELNELKSRFVSMASHQFRTPLSSILSSVQLIEVYTTETQQPKRKKHVDRVQNSVKTMTEILNDFLSLSKLEEGQFQLQPTNFTLADFCKEVMDEMQGLLKINQRIQSNIPQQNEVVYLDKQYFKNILFNLMSNAIKYSEAGTTIFCEILITTLLSKSKELIVKIKDEGIGIPKEDQKHLFTRFFRAHNAENIQGTGLGLNIVRRYVDLMKGTIDFESEVGIGSTFIVTIPLNNFSSLKNPVAAKVIG